MSTEVTLDTTKIRVLVVDDDAALRRMVNMVLEDAGWDVLEAKDGYEAIATLRSSPSRLVALVDWRMPGMSGEDLLDTVVADPELAVRHAYALITANAATLSPHLVDLLSQLSAPVVAKPCGIRELLGTVEDQARRICVEEVRADVNM